jgi:hypothetical protein
MVVVDNLLTRLQSTSVGKVDKFHSNSSRARFILSSFFVQKNKMTSEPLHEHGTERCDICWTRRYFLWHTKYTNEAKEGEDDDDKQTSLQKVIHTEAPTRGHWYYTFQRVQILCFLIIPGVLLGCLSLFTTMFIICVSSSDVAIMITIFVPLTLWILLIIVHCCVLKQLLKHKWCAHIFFCNPVESLGSQYDEEDMSQHDGNLYPFKKFSDRLYNYFYLQKSAKEV